MERRERGVLASRALRAVGANIVGAVLNDPDQKISSHGRYSYYYDSYTESAAD